MNLNNQEEIDRLLLVQIKNGKEDAFNSLVTRWNKRIFNFALRYSNDRSFAEEVVQKTFIQLFQKVDQLQDLTKFKPWFYRIANNLCISEGRRIKRKKEIFMPMTTIPSVTDRVNPATIYEKDEKSKLVIQALQSIPGEQRQVIIMKEYEGLKFREIAEVLGESENTIKSRMYYGLDAMRKLLLKQSWTKDIYYE